MAEEAITDWKVFVSHSIGTIKTKVCIKCKEELPISKFAKRGKENYPRTECMSCAKKIQSVINKLKQITPKPKSDHLCPICKCDEKEAKGRGGTKSTAWALDHDHITETFRGWLCHSCNRSVGNFGDDIERLKRAIIYLKGE